MSAAPHRALMANLVNARAHRCDVFVCHTEMRYRPRACSRIVMGVVQMVIQVIAIGVSD